MFQHKPLVLTWDLGFEFTSLMPVWHLLALQPWSRFSYTNSPRFATGVDSARFAPFPGGKGYTHLEVTISNFHACECSGVPRIRKPAQCAVTQERTGLGLRPWWFSSRKGSDLGGLETASTHRCLLVFKGLQQSLQEVQGPLFKHWPAFKLASPEVWTRNQWEKKMIPERNWKASDSPVFYCLEESLRLAGVRSCLQPGPQVQEVSTSVLLGLVLFHHS